MSFYCFRSMGVVGVGAVLMVVGAAASPAKADLIGYWPMTEGTGNVTANVGTQGNAGPLTNGTWTGNAVTWVNDPQRGTVLSFDGTANISYVDAGDVIIGGADDYTWSVWVKANNAGDKVLLGAREPDAGGGWNKLTSNKYEPNTLNGVTISNPIANDQWIHLALTRNGSTVTLYQNGAVVGSNAAATGDNSGGAPFYLGGDPTFNENHNGLLDDAAVWNVALTPEQIGQLAAGASPLSVPEPTSCALVTLGAIGITARRRRSQV